jgi:hypothetical protein
LLAAERLMPTSTATTVRLDGKRVGITDEFLIVVIALCPEVLRYSRSFIEPPLSARTRKSDVGLDLSLHTWVSEVARASLRIQGTPGRFLRSYCVTSE